MHTYSVSARENNECGYFFGWILEVPSTPNLWLRICMKIFCTDFLVVHDLSLHKFSHVTFTFRLNTRPIIFSHSADLIKRSPYILRIQVPEFILRVTSAATWKKLKTLFRQVKHVFMKRQRQITILHGIYIYIYTHTQYIQGVPGGKDLTSGECSLGQTIPI